MPIATGNGGSISYIELEQDASFDFPFGVGTHLVFDAGIVGSAGTDIALNVAKDTVTLTRAGFYVFTVNLHLSYSTDVTGYLLDIGGWSEQVFVSAGAPARGYALFSAADHYAAGATIQVSVRPNLGAGNTAGNSDFAFAAIAKLG